MIGCVSSVVRLGVEPRPVRVQVFRGGSGPSFHLVGLRDAAVRWAKERVAIESSEFNFPGRRVVANLEGSALILKRPIMGAIAYGGQR
jgi:predicted ATPase with chaperone activity